MLEDRSPHSPAQPAGRPVASGQPAGWPAAFDRLAPVVFPLPAVLFSVALLAFPVVYTVWMSLQDWFISGVQQPTFVGLENYRKLLLEDQRFLEAVLRTVQFTALAVAAETVLGIAAALVFAREFWGRGFWRTLYILPMMATPVAIALIFVMLFHPSLGVLNWFVTTLGLPPGRWTYARETVIPALVLVDIWQWTPLVMLIVLGGLAALPPEPFESAAIDGASGWQTFWYLTLPLLRPTIVVAMLFRSIDALKTFDIIYVMTQGGPGTASQTINIYLFDVGFQYFRMGYASAIVVLFFALILGCSLLLIRVRRASWD